MNHFARALVGCCAVGWLALLSTAAAQAPVEVQAPAEPSGTSSPSKLDYLVLASLADAPSLIGMSIYGAGRNEAETRTLRGSEGY